MTAEVATPTSTDVLTLRTIRVVTTRGVGGSFEIRNGIEWGELKKELQNRNHSLSNMKVVEGQRRTTLEHPKAVVPDGDLDIFLMPYRSKGGAKPVKKAIKKAPKKAVAKKAVVKKAAPKKAAKKAVPKKVVAKGKPRKAKVVEVEDKVEQPKLKSSAEVEEEYRQLAKGFDDVRI